MVTASDSDIRDWVLRTIREISDDNKKVEGAVVTLRLLMPMWQTAFAASWMAQRCLLVKLCAWIGARHT